MSRLRFVFDVNRCTGCDACRLACLVENGRREAGAMEWRKVHTYNEKAAAGEARFHLSLACQHCADPACLKACPARAYRLDAESGAVLLDRDRCIGCRYCIWACPYGAPVFDSTSGSVSKCTYCHDRQKRSLAPACASLCPTGALGVEERGEDFTDRAFRTGSYPGADRHGPALRAVPLREGRLGFPAGDARPVPQVERSAGAVSIRDEWPLALFTWLATILVALFAASLFRPPAPPPVAIVAGGIAALALSALHLGRPFRAWRAVLGWHCSPLSREIVLYVVFLAAAAVSFLPEPGGAAARIARAAAVLAGFAFLYAVDQVYARVRPANDRSLHSAGALGTGAFLAALFAGALPAAALLGLARLALYLARKARAAREGMPLFAPVALARIGLGFIVPVLLLLSAPAGFAVAAAVSILAGDLADRFEYYLDLRVADPEQMMVNFAAKRTGIHGIDH